MCHIDLTRSHAIQIAGYPGDYLGVKTCEVFLCFVAIVRVKVNCVDFFVLFGFDHW